MMTAGEKRGFASMDQDRQKQIASMGGRAAHEKGTAHEFTTDEARAAGRKGGEAVSRDRAHMAAIGRKGGEARSEGRGRRTRRKGQPAEGDGATPEHGGGNGGLPHGAQTNGHHAGDPHPTNEQHALKRPGNGNAAEPAHPNGGRTRPVLP